MKRGFFFIFKLKFCFPNARACLHAYVCRLKNPLHSKKKHALIYSRRLMYLSILLTYMCISRLHLYNMREKLSTK